jgi:predicted secreted protein
VLKKIVGVQVPPKLTKQDKEADLEASVPPSYPEKKKTYRYIAITIISAIVLFIVIASVLQYISSVEEGIGMELPPKQAESENQMNRR